MDTLGRDQLTDRNRGARLDIGQIHLDNLSTGSGTFISDVEGDVYVLPSLYPVGTQ